VALPCPRKQGSLRRLRLSLLLSMSMGPGPRRMHWDTKEQQWGAGESRGVPQVFQTPEGKAEELGSVRLAIRN